MKAFQILVVLATLSSAYSISRGSGKRGIDNTGFGRYLQNTGSYHQFESPNQSPEPKTSAQSYNYLLSSPPIDQLYGNSAQYLKDFSLSTQNIFSQLGSQDLGQDLNSYQSQGYYTQPVGGSSFLPEFRGGNDIYTYTNSPGLGAYGSPSGVSSIKFSQQPVQSTAPLNTRLTSSPLKVSYPAAIVPVSGYSPAYPPYQTVGANPVSQPPISLGSGSLGVTQLNNGNFALGSGSIGYGGTPPIVGRRNRIAQQVPVF